MTVTVSIENALEVCRELDRLALVISSAVREEVGRQNSGECATRLRAAADRMIRCANKQAQPSPSEIRDLNDAVAEAVKAILLFGQVGTPVSESIHRQILDVLQRNARLLRS